MFLMWVVHAQAMAQKAWEGGRVGAWEGGSLGAWEGGSLGWWEPGRVGGWEGYMCMYEGGGALFRKSAPLLQNAEI